MCVRVDNKTFKGEHFKTSSDVIDRETIMFSLLILIICIVYVFMTFA